MKRCIKTEDENGFFGPDRAVETDFRVSANLIYPVYEERIVLQINGNDAVLMSHQEARKMAIALLTAAQHVDREADA